jgi:hypothetical protein
MGPGSLFQHLAVEEQKGAEGLILSGGSDIFVHCQVGQEGFDLGSAHLGRMADVVEVDVAFDPVDVGLFGADGIMFDPDGVTGSNRAVS